MRRTTVLVGWTVFLALALAAGCSDSGDKIVKGVPLAGKFPGNDVADNNLASDGLALSENGMSVIDGPRPFYSSTGNRGITLYLTTTNSGTPSVTLWAVYWDGKKLYPPVEVKLRGSPNNAASPQNDDKQGANIGAFDLQEAIVMFYEPGSESANRDTSRRGDAVILFRQYDVDDAPIQAPSVENQNIRLWWLYHDMSMANDASMAHGFGTWDTSGTEPLFRPGYADIVDSDDGDNIGDTSEVVDNNEQDDNVLAFGVVSDGVRGQALWADGGGFAQLEDFSDYLVATWVQLDEVDNQAGTDDIFDLHLWQTRFDITAEPPQFAVPARIDPSTNTLEGTAPATDDSLTLVFPIISTYENSILYSVIEDIFGDADEAYQYNHYTGDATNGFTSGSFFSNSVQFSPLHDTTDGFGSEGFLVLGGTAPLWQMYGRDHGLSNLVIFSTYNIGDPANDDDVDLFVSRFDYTATTGSGAHNPGQDTTQADETGAMPLNERDVDYWETRISRDSDYILIAYIQEDLGGLEELRLRRFTTDEIGGTPVSGPITSAIGATVAGSDDAATGAVEAFSFQGELANPFLPPSEGKGVTGVERGAIQSDNLIMHLAYEENDDAVTMVDQVHIVQFEYQPSGAGLARRAPMDDFPDGSLTSGGPNALEGIVRVLDDGDGGVVTYYSRDRNFKDPMLAPAPTLSARRFDGTTMTTRVDLNSPGLNLDPGNFTALTAGDGDPAGDWHLLFFGEDRLATFQGTPVSSIANRFRRFPKLQAGDPFDPMSYSEIQTVDANLPIDSDVFAGTFQGSTSNVGIYIEQGGHIYYNEYNAQKNTWLDASEHIVDNDSSNDAISPAVSNYRSFVPPDSASSGELSKAITWWLRLDLDGDLRLHARVRK